MAMSTNQCHLTTASGQPLVPYKIIGPADAIAEEDMATPPASSSPYWQLKLLLVTLLGIGAIVALASLALLGHFELYNAMTTENSAMAPEKCARLFWYILGGEAATLVLFGAAYKKLHHSSAKFYAFLADNWLGKYLGLRTHAGRWGMLSRSVRTVAAIAYISLIVIAMMSGDIAAGVNALVGPYQAIIGMTWLGILPGIVANNAKIEQLYTAENRLLDSVNLALAQVGEDERNGLENQLRVGRQIPHGMHALCNAQRADLFTSLFVRKVHDFNSIVGSLLSVTRFIATILLPLAAVVSSFSIPPVFFAIVIGSSILSSCVTWYTNWSRLQAHRNLMLDIYHDYWVVQKHVDVGKVEKAKGLAEQIFNQLTTKPTNPFVSKAIRFHLSKALLKYYVTSDSNESNAKEELTKQLVELLEKIIAPKGRPAGFLTRFVNRDPHNTRDGLAHAYDSFTKISETESMTTFTTDGLFALEDQIVKCIIDCKINPQQQTCTEEAATPSSHDRPQQDKHEPDEQPPTASISFDDQYKAICKSISEQVNKIDPRHLHWLAFGLVTACYRKQQSMTVDVSRKAVTYLQTKGVFNNNRLDTGKVMNTEEYKCAVKDPHGNQPLQPSITKMCNDVIDKLPPAAAAA
jgi:hypothetical protein